MRATFVFMSPTATTEDSRPLLRPAEAADRLAVTRKTVCRLIDRSELCAVHVGRAVRIAPDDLDAYLDEEDDQ